MFKENRVYAIALNGRIIYKEMIEGEMLSRFEELMYDNWGNEVEVFQYVRVIPCTGYKIAEDQG
jgi:hypothetical protein